MKADIKALIKIFRNISYVLTGRQKRKCLYVGGLILFGSMLETLGVSAVLPFVQVFLNPDSLRNNKYFISITGWLGIGRDINIVLIVGIGLAIVYIIKNILLSWSSYKQIKLRWDMQRDLSTKMLESYMKRPYTYFLDINSAQVLRGISDDTNSLYTVIEDMFMCLSYVLTIIMVSVCLFIQDSFLTISVLVVAGVCFFGITFGFRKYLSGVGQTQRLANTETSKYAYQAVNGIKEIDVMQRKGYFIEKYNNAYIRAAKANIKFNFLNSCPGRIIEAVCVSGIVMVMCFRYSFGNINTQFVATMALFVMGAFKILPLTGNIVSIANHLTYYWPGVEATYNNLKEVELYERQIKKYILQNRRDETVAEKKTMLDGICIEHISWRYPNSQKWVLDNLSLRIQKNESVAFIGSSGAGKTTLSDIILGLYKPQRGNINIDGIDIFTIPNEWSKMIGYVPQSVFLIDDTIRANVTFGIAEEDINDEMVWDALERAQLADFIKSLPNGVHTKVGERGIKFSGGQRQRIAIARALYYNPEILILDEATAALDNETEAAVMESIELLQGNKTLIIIAHRLSTIRNCDKIYEIIDGKAKLRDKREVFC